jgi:hypothetical protein
MKMNTGKDAVHSNLRSRGFGAFNELGAVLGKLGLEHTQVVLGG